MLDTFSLKANINKRMSLNVEYHKGTELAKRSLSISAIGP